MSRAWSTLHGTALLSTLVTGFTNTAVAQSSITPVAAPAEDKETRNAWGLSPAARVRVEYDNNVFLLSGSRKIDLAAPSSAEVASGRYADMESAHDIITSMSAAVELKGPGLQGETFRLTPSIGYDLYHQNSIRSSATLGVSLVQDLGKGGRLRLQGRLTPSYFAKNYLIDAVDTDATGTISDGERVYAPGEYRESDVSADIRVRLVNATRKQSIGAAVQVSGGYYARTNDVPFAARDLRGPELGAKVLFELGRRVGLDLEYAFATLSADPADQVQLLDEADYAQDLNGNGISTDQDVRVVSRVDRSRREHSIGAALRVDLRRTITLGLGYEHRARRYTSAEPMDPSNNGRRDSRNQIGAELGFKVARGLRLHLGGRHSTQSLNRASDPGATGDVSDYTRDQATLGLTYDF